VRRNLKRTLFLIVPLAVLAIGWPSTASAQGRRGRVVSRVVVGGPYAYRPFFYGPFYNPYWDRDGDGIPNRYDRTPHARYDRDGDGIPNWQDRNDGRPGRGR